MQHLSIEEIQARSLVGQTLEQIKAQLSEWGEPSYRAEQIYKWVHRQNVDSFEEMTNIPKALRQKLEDHNSLKTLTLVKKESARDGTVKFLWKLYDGRHIESVWIPEKKRNTLCVSSQVGCSLGCDFCATGTMGLIRNLTPGEIVEQVLQVQKHTGNSLTNVVFMGMGEPFLNYGRVIQACQILNDPLGVAISARKITISTSGVTPKIYQFADEQHPYKLAISLHAPTQELREKFMPIAKKFPLDGLVESLKYYMQKNKRYRVTFEYILLRGINSSPAHARQLISLLGQLRSKLNLIPCNENDLGFEAPTAEEISTLMKAFEKAPFAVMVRKNRGEDITAACGQLAVEVTEKSIHMK
ncbi:MAG: bifunctional tRNA (adenosine(37)-C2)-methyltransferase TrmG/ribosomal RNA large subunit methyltransferase RlmN [Calditrichia bacterium]